MGSVKYRSRAIDKPLAGYKVLVWLMISIRKGRGAREKMQRISLQSTGDCASLPISVYLGLMLEHFVMSLKHGKMTLNYSAVAHCIVSVSMSDII